MGFPWLPWSVASDSAVRHDWRGQLPEAQQALFQSMVGELQASYGMLSVTLDEAFGLRSRSLLSGAREAAGASAELFERVALDIGGILRVVARHARPLGVLPEVTPLDPEFFRGKELRSAAVWNGLLHYVLPGARYRFLIKVRTLSGAVADLSREFHLAAEEIADGSSIQPEFHWQTLNTLHFDLNTCLQETVVILKSFLGVLPEEQVEALRGWRAATPGRPQLDEREPTQVRLSA